MLCLTLAACRVEGHPGISRAWPELGTMMSVAAWGADSGRVVRALEAAHDSVDHIDALLQRHVAVPAIDSVRRAIRQRTGTALVPADSLAFGYALDRAALALANIADSALLDVGGQYFWLGSPTHRAVGIPDPDNTLRTLAVVDLQGGSLSTESQRNAPRGSARSVTVLAAGGLAANAWAAALLPLRGGCDSVLVVAAELSVVCADSARVRWTSGLQNRVSLPAARAP